MARAAVCATPWSRSGCNDTGGLPEDICQEIKSAALAAISNWLDGALLALARPDDAMLARMLSVSMGEISPPITARSSLRIWA